MKNQRGTDYNRFTIFGDDELIYKVLMEEAEVPDLLLVDGGELQINVAKEIINSLLTIYERKD